MPDNELPKITESQLAIGLKPIRNFFLAQTLYHFLDIGIQRVISNAGTISIADVACSLNLNTRRLTGLLNYLANEGYVEIENATVSLTPSGREVSSFYPWYKLLVGGYSTTISQLSDALRADSGYASRDSGCVGLGSCGISQYDALPMTRILLEQVKAKWHTLIDLGCGDGSYLVDLCKSLPNSRGIGLDPSPQSVELAKKAIVESGLENRIEVCVGNAFEVPILAETDLPVCFITAFVFQEILEQSGRDAVIEVLTSNFQRYPNSHWVVIEVDDRADDERVMSTELGLGYYNAYYLIHHLTEQRLETNVFWTELFAEAGIQVMATVHPDATYDSLKLKTGFLLRLANGC